MLFSVIIPTCNRNELLSNCLYLLTKQIQTIDSSKYEVIVTDDSKDNVAKNLIEDKHPQIKWVEGPKKGPAANRNNGAKHATAEWLVFLDDDCLPKADILESYELLIIKNPNTKVFEGWIERERRMKSPLERAPGNSNSKGGFLLSCNFAIEKRLFFEIGGFDENFKYPHMEDYDFNHRLIASNNKPLFAVEAKVVHPYRKIKDGWKLGKFEEMSVYYNSKYGKQMNLHTLLKGIASIHLIIIVRFLKRLRFSLDILTAFKIMFQHLVVVLFNFHKWKRKYSKLVYNAKN
jgi:GT2 family glycosyltransferase